MHIDSHALAIIALTFLLGGIVKGIVGLGLSSVSLAVLTATIGLQPAMALLLGPTFVTHVWQAMAGTHTWRLLARLWLFILATVTTIWLGVSLSATIRMWALVATLGIVQVGYAMVGLCRLQLPMPKHRAMWVNPLAGFLTGVCTGLSGAFEASGAGYFHIVGLPRHQLVQATAILGTMSTIGLAISLSEQRLLTTELGVVSAGAVAPSVLGMILGTRWRKKLPKASLPPAFFAVLLALGLYVLTLCLE